MTVIRRRSRHLPLDYYQSLSPAERAYAVQITDAILADLTRTRVDARFVGHYVGPTGRDYA